VIACLYPDLFPEKYISRRLLFEENKQRTGDCRLTGRFAEVQSLKPPRIAVNNHQEEINNE
jgi:hypothetical protein